MGYLLWDNYGILIYGLIKMTSDESSLGFLRYTNLLSNLITSTLVQPVCVFFGRGKGGDTPFARTQGEFLKI